MATTTIQLDPVFRVVGCSLQASGEDVGRPYVAEPSCLLETRLDLCDLD